MLMQQQQAQQQANQQQNTMLMNLLHQQQQNTEPEKKGAKSATKFSARRAEGGILTGGTRFVGGPRCLYYVRGHFIK